MAGATKAQLEKQLSKLAELGNNLHGEHFLATWNHSDKVIRQIQTMAETIEMMWKSDVSPRVFDSGIGLSIFRDQSTRTRYAFKSGCNMLGLQTEELNEKTSQVAHGETVRETAAMIAFHTDVVGIRDDIYLGMGHDYITQFADALSAAFDEGVLNQRTGLINLQSDLDHPTQSMSDLRHLMTTFGGRKGLRGKKIAMSWAYSPSYGKPLSVAQGIVGLMTRFGMDVVLAHPPGYELQDDVLQTAARQSERSNGSFSVTHSMDEAFADADIVYPKSWAPMAVMHQRTALLKSKREKAVVDRELAELERSCLAQNAEYKSWECNADRMAKTKDALYMHCLPADITGVSCEAGEVSADVFEKYRVRTYHEASYKPYVIAALTLLTRFANPASLLSKNLDRRRAEPIGG